MDTKNQRLYEIFRAAIDYYIEIEGKLKGERAVFVGTVSTTKYSGDNFTAELRFKSSDNEEPDAIYGSSSGKLFDNVDELLMMDTIESINIVF